MSNILAALDQLHASLLVDVSTIPGNFNPVLCFHLLPIRIDQFILEVCFTPVVCPRLGNLRTNRTRGKTDLTCQEIQLILGKELGMHVDFPRQQTAFLIDDQLPKTLRMYRPTHNFSSLLITDTKSMIPVYLIAGYFTGSSSFIISYTVSKMVSAFGLDQ